MQKPPKAGHPCPNDRPCECICHAGCTRRVRLARPGFNVRGRDKEVCAPADIALTPRIDVRCSIAGRMPGRVSPVANNAVTRPGLGCIPTFEVQPSITEIWRKGALAGEERSVQPVTVQTTVCGKIVLIRKCNTHSVNWPRHASDTLFNRSTVILGKHARLPFH